MGMIEKVFILPEVKRKFESYIRNCAFEISGLGMVEERGDKLVITEIYLLEQEGSGGSTVLSPAALAKFVTELAMSGVDTSKLKWWWHSHVNFQTFWSVTDEACMEAFKPGDYFIATVGNKKGESRTRLDIYNPVRISLDNVPLEVVYDDTLEADVIAEIKAKVKEVRIFPSRTGAVGGGRNNGSYTRRTTVGKNSQKPLLELDSDFYDPDAVGGDGDAFDFGNESDYPPCFTTDEFRVMAQDMGIGFSELLQQENMTHSNGYVF